MEHEEIRLKLAAYLDNAVSAEEKGEIKRHLGMCGRCREDIADLELTVRYLKSIPEVEPPPWLSERIIARVRNEATQEKSLWRRLFFPLHVKLPVEAFAVLFLCLTGYYLATNLSEQAPNDARVLTRPERSKEGDRPSGILPDEQGVPSPSRPQSDLSRRKREYPLPTDTQEPEQLPSAAAVQKEPAPLPLSSSPPPLRRQTEPELQPIDEGFMSNRETTIPVKEERVAGALKAGKRVASGEGAPLPPAQSLRKEEIALAVDDPAASAGAIEEAVTRTGGRIKGHSHSGETHLLFFQIGADRLPRLLDRLGRIGKLKERPQPPKANGGLIDVTLRW